MTDYDGPEWQPTFDQVNKEPSSNKPKKRLTEKDLQDRNSWIERRRNANIAVSFGGVDTGDDWDPLGWLSNWSFGVQTSLTENTDAIAELADIARASVSTQAYVADIQDMATCPRRDLAAWTHGSIKWVDILQGMYCSFDDHYHTIGTGTIVPETKKGSTKGHIYYTPIIVDRVGTLLGLRWIVGSDSSIFSIDYYEVALCAYDPTSGNILKLWGSGDIKDGTPSTTETAEAYLEFGFGTPQETTPGQILFFAHQQVAPGLLQSGRRLASSMAPPAGRPDQLLDAACYVAEEYTQGIPSSISLASLTRENRFIPWGAVRVQAASVDI